MSEETTTYRVPDEVMQKLSDADAALADLVMEAMMTGDGEAMELLMPVGLALFELEHTLVEKGWAREVLDRSDRGAQAA